MAGRDLFAQKPTKPAGRDLFASQPEQQPAQRASNEPTSFQSFVEPMATMATGMVAEPIAGLAGIAQSVNPFAAEGAGDRAVQATREALTFRPGTERGQELLGEIGEFVEPAGKALSDAEKGFGDSVYNATGSPTLSAAAASIPTAIMEILPIAASRGAIKTARASKLKAREGQIAREMTDALPTIDQLKDTSRGVFKEIDEMGVSVIGKAYDNMVDDVSQTVRKLGIDSDITPKASKALARLDELKGQDVPLSELDTLREVAKGAAGSLEPKEAMLGVVMIEKIDNFLSSSDAKSLRIPATVDSKNVGKLYKVGRDMWGRARKSEMLQESFEKARNQASGFENGVRVQFRSILNNKRKRRFFNADELEAMTKVVRGGKKENFAKLIGRFGFSEGGATNAMMGTIGIGAGAAAGGAPGAMIVPLIGQVSRKLAQRMTVKGAEFADQVIRAGRNGKKITAAYMRNTPKAQRSAQELSELLTRGDIDMLNLVDDPIVRSAKQIAAQRRAELAAVAATPTLTNQEEN